MNEFNVYPLPHGFNAEGCTVVRIKGDRDKVFVKAPDGTIYTAGMRVVSMTRDWDANDAQRRAFAKLAGIKFATIANARKARNKAQAKLDAEREIDRIRRSAKRLGLKVTRASAHNAR